MERVKEPDTSTHNPEKVWFIFTLCLLCHRGGWPSNNRAMAALATIVPGCG
jgi:hypothetical protein